MMRIHPFRAARGPHLVAASTVAIAAVLAALVFSQSEVTGAERQPSARFSVAGDGEFATSRPSLGDARDPLSTEEAGYAIQLATTGSSVSSDVTNVSREPGAEFLRVDLPDDVDGTGRKALVVLYDYTANTTYHQLVNLKTGNVTSRSTQGLQPPPSLDETKVAVTIALGADPALPFAAQFEATEGVPLLAPEQVHYVAGSWVFEGATASGKRCGTDRCMRLLINTPSGNYLSTSDFVINLSQGTVITLKKKP